MLNFLVAVFLRKRERGLHLQVCQFGVEVLDAVLALAEGTSLDAVGQRQFGSHGDIVRGDAVAPLKGCLRAGGFEDDQVGAVPIDFHRGGQLGDDQQVALGVGDVFDQFLGGSDPVGKLKFLGQKCLAEGFGVALKGDVAAHDLDALGFIQYAVNFDGKGEAVEQLRAQVALFGVHRANEDEAGGVAEGDAFAFDDVGAHGGGVEQDINDVVVEQVDFVDVEQAAVGACQHAWLKMALAFLDGAFDIEGADDAVFGGGDGQVDKGGGFAFVGQRVFAADKTLLTFGTPGGRFGGVAVETAVRNNLDGGQEGCQGAGGGGFGSAAFAADEDAADARVYRVEDEGAHHALLPNNGGEGKYYFMIHSRFLCKGKL